MIIFIVFNVCMYIQAGSPHLRAMAAAQRFARQWQQRHGSSSSVGQWQQRHGSGWQQSHGSGSSAGQWQQSQQRAASLIKNYFVTSSTEPHTWAWSGLHPATGFPAHARVNVPVGTTTIEEFGNALRRHPKVLKVEGKKRKTERTP